MPLSVVYINVDGQPMSEIRGGVVTEYVHDPLGNLIATNTSVGIVTWTGDYWPYGESMISSGTKANNWGFCAAWGYYDDGYDNSYVRRRILRRKLARWQTVDPMLAGFLRQKFEYCHGNPLNYYDKTGLLPRGLTQLFDPGYMDQLIDTLIRTLPDYSPPAVYTPPLNLANGEDAGLPPNKRPNPARTTDCLFSIACNICIKNNNIEATAGQYPGDKVQHYMAGCLAAIRCAPWCGEGLGSLKELSDAIFGGTVGRADAIATDDGYAWGQGYKGPENDVDYCLRGSRNTPWWTWGLR